MYNKFPVIIKLPLTLPLNLIWWSLDVEELVENKGKVKPIHLIPNDS